MLCLHCSSIFFNNYVCIGVSTYGVYSSLYLFQATKIGKINLAATGKDLMDDEKQEITIDLHTALEMENDIIEERAPEIEKNQKLGLLLGFLSVHDWYIPCMLLI
jgi:THO complex subunit 2